MRVSFWSLNALTGEVAGEVPVLGWSITGKLGGSTLRATVGLNAATRNGRSPDYPEIRRRHGLVQPGFRSLVAVGVLTDEAGHDIEATRGVLGEFLVDHTEPSSDSTDLPVSGVSWEAYPAYKAQSATQRYSSIDTGAWLKSMLELVFAGAAITIPAFTSNTVATGIDRPIFSGQWADAIREATDADPGVEWLVETTGVFDGPTLKSVSRSVRFGAPVIQRGTDLVFEAGEPMTRQGNCAISGGGERFADYARQVIGLGPGEGSKQLVSLASASALSARGYLDATTVASFSDVNSKTQLDALVRQELRRAQGVKNHEVSLPRDPWTIRAKVDHLTRFPRVGDAARLLHRQSQGYPGVGGFESGAMAVDEQIRIGEVAYSASGPICEDVEVRAL